jgi:hypothetical protein
MSGNPMFQANPLLSQWLSAANSATQAWRGFWTAEFARQQTAMVTEWNRQAAQFWVGAWTAPLMAAAPKPVTAPETETKAAPALNLAEMAEPVPLPAAPAAEATSVVPALPEESPKPAVKPKKGAVQLRTATEARRAKAPHPRSPKLGRVTRH